MSCPECGGECVWDEQVCSSLCTQCGTLADPDQCLLASHVEHHEGTGNAWISSATYSSVRGKKGWNLAGQTKEARDRKNKIAMGNFISSVLTALGSPGLSPRAETVFTQAMSKGAYRWGRKAKLVAGAAIAIVLREAHKSDSLRDIAFLLNESSVSLSRAFQSVVSLLDFSLSSVDPAVHLPILQAHLQSLIHPETLSTPSQLPKDLIAVLAPLSLPTAVRTATSLSGIIYHQIPLLPLTQLPTPPTACALFILGLEAETRAPLPHVGELACCLSSRFGLAGGVVTSRYKAVYDLIEEWIREVPWLDQFVYKNKGRGSSARSKVPKRAIVARGIKDIIQFQEEIWMKRLSAHRNADLVLECVPDAGDDDGEFKSTSASSQGEHVEDEPFPQPARKKLKTKHGRLHDAYRLLLDPLSSSLANSPVAISQNQSDSTRASSPDLSPITRILTCSPSELARHNKPTRLQLLAESRGGSAPENVADEELFEDGELEGLIRSEREQEALKPLFELNWGGESSDDEALVTPGPAKQVGVKADRGAQRVNMEALARILGEHGGDDLSDVDNAHHFDDPSSSRKIAEGAESVSEWRSLSPNDGFGAYFDTMAERYEEEY